MVKTILIALLLLLAAPAGFGQRNVSGIIRELKNLDGGERISGKNICIDMEDEGVNLRIKSVEVLQFRERNHPLFEEHFRNALENIQEHRYQMLPTGGSRESVYIRSKNGYIRELVVFRTGSRFGMIHARGKIRISDFWDDLAQKLNIETTVEPNERPVTPERPAHRERHRRSDSFGKSRGR